MKINSFNLIISFILLIIPLSGQTLKQELTKIFSTGNQGELEEYLGPLSEAFGANLGSAIYFNAESYSFPHFDIGINYLTTSVPKNSFVSDSTDKPTVFGKSIYDSSALSGLNISRFDIPVLQFNLGLGENTNLIFRYTEWKMNKVGNIRVLGGGIKYEMENLLSITPIPLDIAVLAMYQKYEVDDFLEGAVFNISIVGSKDFGIVPLQLYGGAGFLNNITEVSDPAGFKEEAISIKGLEEIRYQVGISYSLLFFNLNIEYNFGDYRTVSSGIKIVL